jgi:hypothetical protein
MSKRLDSTYLYAGHSLVIGGASAAPRGPPPPLPPPGPSALAARLSQFLPAMERANAALAARIEAEGAAAVDIEAVPEGAASHIEMNVALAELPEGAGSGGSSSEEESEGEGGGGGGGGGGGRRRAPRIEELSATAGGGGGGGGGSGSGGGGSGGGASGSEEDSGSDCGEGLPAGKWITGAALEQLQREDIMRLLSSGVAADAASSGGEEGGGPS